MENLGKRKLNEGGVNQVSPGLIAGQQTNCVDLSSVSKPATDGNDSNICYSARKRPRKSKATTKFTQKKIETSIIESAEGTSRHQQSEQQSASRMARECRTALHNFLSALSPPPHACHMVPAKEVNVARRDAFASITPSSKQVAIEVVRVDSDVEDQTRDKFDNRLPVSSPYLAGNTSSSDRVAGDQADAVEDRTRDRFNDAQPMDENLDQSCEIIGSCRDDSSNEEVKFSFSLVAVGGYNVKKAAAPMLRRILDKHGDIARDCTAMTLAGRSLFLETICDIMLNLQKTKFTDLEDSDIKGLKDKVEELGKDKLQVGWLLNRLEEILEAKKVIKSSAKLKETKAAKSAFIQKSKKAEKQCDREIEKQMTKIAEYDAIIAEYNAKKLETVRKIEEIEKKKCLEQENQKNAEAVASNIRKMFVSSEANVKAFISNSLIHGLI